ncbi:uncharacterized protein LOC115564008 [Drosophila navojoa]|nr:uncharacterized protein LOC115564008 [Drosophila navojoa]
MKLLILACLLCLARSHVRGMFFELPENAAESADEADFMDEALNNINQYFGVPATTATSARPKATAATATATSTSSGLLDEVETSLEHATSTLNDLWQQFRKGLAGLLGDLNEDNKDTDRPNATTAQGLEQVEVNTAALLAELTSTTHRPMPETTKATTMATTPTARATATTTVRPATP